MPHLRPVDLEGRVALVTGGTSELGAAFVELLGSAGAEVAVAGEPGPALSRMAIRLGVETYECDPADPEAARAAAAEIAERLGRLDLVVCVRDSEADLEATASTLRDAGATIAAGGRGGRILLVGPSDDLSPARIREAAERAVDGVGVNAVLHGPLRAPEPDEWQEDELCPELGTLAAAEVARAAIWLLDPEVEGVSGIVLDLDAATRPASI